MGEKLTAGQLQIGDIFTIDTSEGNHQAQVVKVDQSGVYYAPPAPGEAHRFMMPDGSITNKGGIPVKGIVAQRIVTKP